MHQAESCQHFCCAPSLPGSRSWTRGGLTTDPVHPNWLIRPSRTPQLAHQTTPFHSSTFNPLRCGRLSIPCSQHHGCIICVSVAHAVTASGSPRARTAYFKHQRNASGIACRPPMAHPINWCAAGRRRGAPFQVRMEREPSAEAQASFRPAERGGRIHAPARGAMGVWKKRILTQLVRGKADGIDLDQERSVSCTWRGRVPVRPAGAITEDACRAYS